VRQLRGRLRYKSVGTAGIRDIAAKLLRHSRRVELKRRIDKLRQRSGKNPTQAQIAAIQDELQFDQDDDQAFASSILEEGGRYLTELLYTVPYVYRPQLLAPVLAMDAAHMRGRQGGTMYTLWASSANSGSHLVAVGFFAAAENGHGWGTFLRFAAAAHAELRSHTVTFVSDEHPAIAQQFPRTLGAGGGNGSGGDGAGGGNGGGGDGDDGRRRRRLLRRLRRRRR
jgi:hypothetical protein